MTTAESVIFLAFVTLALALTIFAFTIRKATLAFAGAGAWMLLGVYSYAQSATPSGGAWDIYYALFFLSVGLVLLCVLEPAIMKERKQEQQEDLYVDDIDRFEKDWEDLQRRTRIPRLRRHSSSPRRGR